MARGRRIALVVTMLVLALPAAAQINPFPNRPRAFAEADRQRMYRAMIEVLESQNVGEVATWTGESDAIGGTAELRSVYTQDGLVCGELRHRFRDLDTADTINPDVTFYDVRACEVPGEGWRFAF